MGKHFKIWLVTAIVLLVIGSLLFGGAMTMLGWDFSKLSTDEYRTTTHAISEDFSNISIDTDTAKLLLVPSEDDACTVVCYEREKVYHSVSVKDNTLTISVVDTRKWHEYIGINVNFQGPKVTVYLPAGLYGALTVKTDTGSIKVPEDFSFESSSLSSDTGSIQNYASVADFLDIKTSTGKILVEGVTVGTLNLSASTGSITASDITCEGDASFGASTGKTTLSDITCQNLNVKGETGKILLTRVLPAKRLTVKNDTGNVHLDHCDAAEIGIYTDTGNVKGSILSEKVFRAHSDTGNVVVPDTLTGGKCEIISDTGNIEIVILKET